ncbi:putative histone-lysine N-methyltransferase Mes-4 [Pseudolycoriella hygida]|uniref:Histone-lysine N-methyltransferase Mes-4 n=1 Tax=Pseudolycoriella hygida TaxID=35572 RepID=A0A9Q0S081_9DIPT|nr:putative histone-lysine N-methyltransferase Mes-4 [Pseudolycoriella hygida]
MNENKKVTSHRNRHSYSDRNDKMHKPNNSSPFKTPTIPLRRVKKSINRLERNHHNYSSSLNCTIVKDYRTVLQTTKQKLSHSTSTSSKSVNKRKSFKYTYTRIQSNHLIDTPAGTMLGKISKRSREMNEKFISPKRRKIEAHSFNVESDDESDHQISLGKLFDVDTTMSIPSVKKLPDQNENSLSCLDDMKEYKALNLLNERSKNIELSSMTVHSNSNSVTPKVNVNIEIFKIPDIKFKVPSPVDVKYDFQYPKKTEEIVEDVKPPPVVVKCETAKEKSDSDCLSGQSLSIYVGQVLYARYLKFSYWPAIVYQYDEADDSISVKFFADKGNTGTVKKDKVFEFNGMESYLKYKKDMKSTLPKVEWKAAFNVTPRWMKAVAEGIFILSKEVHMRLAFVDIIVISSLRDAKNPTKLSEMITEHSTPPQLQTVQNLFKENSDIFDEIKENLEKFASSPNVDSDNKRQKLVEGITKCGVERRHSAPPSLKSLKTRHSARLITKIENQLTANQSASEENLHTKEAAPEEKQRKSLDYRQRRELKRIEFEKDLKTYAATASQPDVLFQGLRRGYVCKICLSPDDRDVVQCAGTCSDYVHLKCVDAKKKDAKMAKCPDCVDQTSPICYVCKKTNSTSILRCSQKKCGRSYHMSCLGDWLQTKFAEHGKLICPSHVCHTCVSDDPRNQHFSVVDSKLTHCVKCPSTFHIDSTCITAGVKILTSSQHICIRHRTESYKPVSLNWCYICGETGGNLLCCESCPLTSHMSCLSTPVVGEHYFCDSCETGRHPLYGEIVWAKYCRYRFWPAIIVPPPDIPVPLQQETHNDHELCVRFFGTYEFGWVGRSFVYLYDEGDAEKSTGESRFDDAVREAENCYRNMAVRVKKARKLQPLPYAKISKISKVSPAKLNKTDSEPHPCACKPDDPDPCGPSSGCANRICHTECDAAMCPAQDKCRNQCIDKRQYASFRLEHMGKKGFGLIADTFISEGTMVIEYVGELVTEQEFQSRLATKQTQNFYFMKYGTRQYIDAELKGNMSRFMNHSCNPNVEPRMWAVKGYERVGLVALRNIVEGTELTFNYEYDDSTHECCCGEKCCKGIIGGKIKRKDDGKDDRKTD